MTRLITRQINDADRAFRDGNIAVECALKACELSGWKYANTIDTLAASYAENGQLELAVETQRKAMNLADTAEKAEYQSRLDLYFASRPYREPVKSPLETASTP